MYRRLALQRRPGIHAVELGGAVAVVHGVGGRALVCAALDAGESLDLSRKEKGSMSANIVLVIFASIITEWADLVISAVWIAAAVVVANLRTQIASAGALEKFACFL